MRRKWLVLVVLGFVGASSAFGRVEFLDGGVYDIDYLIDDEVVVAGSTVNLLPGGEITGQFNLQTWSGVLNMYGGTLGATLAGAGIAGAPAPYANIYGGAINGDLAIYAYASSPATFNIYGAGFNYSYGAIPDIVGTLTGRLSNGDAISWDFNLGNSQAAIVLHEREPAVVPAPGAAMLAGLGAGLVGWLRRRRSV